MVNNIYKTINGEKSENIWPADRRDQICSFDPGYENVIIDKEPAGLYFIHEVI